jgi:hypothetical protein
MKPKQKPKAEIKRLLEAVRRAEAELDATTRLSDLRPAARMLVRAKAELKRYEAEAVRDKRRGQPGTLTTHALR